MQPLCLYPRGRILVFARAPVAGKVKRRLIPAYGKYGAARLYRSMLQQTLSHTTGLAAVELWCQPDCRVPYLRVRARQAGIVLRAQRGADLGARMHFALRKALSEAAWAIVVGSDCVSLQREDFRRACDLLEQGREAVLGPAEDGGYLLLGLRRVEAELFRSMPWGTGRVLSRTRRRLRRLGVDFEELPMGWDADRPADVRRWLNSVLSHK